MKFFFLKVIFVVDFEDGLEIDKNFAVWPVSARSSIFGTFVRTHPINLKLYQNIENINLTKNWQYLWSFSQNCHLKSQKLAVVNILV